jgi:Glycosyltransferase WbsX
MRRRDLAGAALAAAITSAGGYFAGRRTRPDLHRVNWKPLALEYPLAPPHPDLTTYFTSGMAARELGVPALNARSDCQMIAYYFPAWHPSPFMERLYGKGWTEFDLARKAKPLFPGHQQPKQPLWGYFDEADPVWAEREIATAADHGIDGWMIDWYWHNGTMFYHEQLEKGFLAASNRSRLKFALMWANHDWRANYPARSPEQAATLLPQTHSEQDCVRVADYCIEHYFRQPNYWRLNGALVFGIFDIDHLNRQLGGPEALKRTLRSMRERVAKAGLGEMHIQSNNVHGHLEGRFKDLGIDSATSYHTFAWSYGARAPGGLSPFSDGAINSILQWKKMRGRCDVPYFPDCPVGWDDSPRFGASAHISVQRSPDQYEILLRAARQFLEGQSQRVIFLSSWNEWTEDHMLLPDSVYGNSYLEAVARAHG